LFSLEIRRLTKIKELADPLLIKSKKTILCTPFPSSAGMSLTNLNLSLAGNNLSIPGQGEFD
jgi:hypothetical protein